MSVRPRPSTRMWIPQDNPAVYKALVALQRASSAGVDVEIGELISMRVSQLNGCAYCLHMHAGDALAAQIDPHKLLMLATWREAGSLFSSRERAVLALAEQLTRLGEGGVDDAVFDDVRTCFDAATTGQLVAAIVMINAWNRIAVAGGYPAGLDERRVSQAAG
ncbi:MULTISPECIES: carboxymuconolactone decarboxylase family protein [Gordonia]|uniref:Carboxymuconolactone decarboxylase-like domain-containing protein n=2 Tax=Gordonia alkanivorans TaxID=84096 RepID=F9VSG7_9ACTN|nr:MULTISPECIES: carboxymuconolactone decarboxylase family protein [Gordonia]ETA08674.1 alkylhydroperoxidase [Gordonia alkanivorans CGMCC 6845]MDH3005338.1 carboxymuconolactone decarboxylase family protein [Gordonia alkanivorans]MDH3010364.1 carboxymuconolactone decarboxylase family protein [Gordonia alkanivorans]MDH3014750.1 carboxymuconolactone decarboxylase family protein [Gordonia alkanivorans]MDH3019159.1 carboxymuconolactone decarboxylase family protein [Gordonia alkanivorans]